MNQELKKSANFVHVFEFLFNDPVPWANKSSLGVFFFNKLFSEHFGHRFMTKPPES
jgi:hypothetical protein